MHNHHYRNVLHARPRGREELLAELRLCRYLASALARVMLLASLGNLSPAARARGERLWPDAAENRSVCVYIWNVIYLSVYVY